MCSAVPDLSSFVSDVDCVESQTHTHLTKKTNRAIAWWMRDKGQVVVGWPVIVQLSGSIASFSFPS